jgi:hypothetical protein
MKHIMIDIETMGNISNSVILSLGAIKCGFVPSFVNRMLSPVGSL